MAELKNTTLRTTESLINEVKNNTPQLSIKTINGQQRLILRIDNISEDYRHFLVENNLTLFAFLGTPARKSGSGGGSLSAYWGGALQYFYGVTRGHNRIDSRGNGISFPIGKAQFTDNPASTETFLSNAGRTYFQNVSWVIMPNQDNDLTYAVNEMINMLKMRNNFSQGRFNHFCYSFSDSFYKAYLVVVPSYNFHFGELCTSSTVIAHSNLSIPICFYFNQLIGKSNYTLASETLNKYNVGSCITVK